MLILHDNIVVFYNYLIQGPVLPPSEKDGVDADSEETKVTSNEPLSASKVKRSKRLATAKVKHLATTKVKCLATAKVKHLATTKVKCLATAKVKPIKRLATAKTNKVPKKPKQTRQCKKWTPCKNLRN